MRIQNHGALKWSNRNQKNRRYADGHWEDTTYILERDTGAGPAVWTAWYYRDDDSPRKLGQGNFIQARGYAISHHHVQKSTPL